MYRSGLPSRRRLLKESVPLSAIGGLNALLTRMTFLARPLRKLVSESGVRTTVGTVLLASGTLMVVVLWLVAIFTGVAALALILAAVAAMIPVIFLRTKREKRIHKFEEQ